MGVGEIGARIAYRTSDAFNKARHSRVLLAGRLYSEAGHPVSFSLPLKNSLDDHAAVESLA
jgi:hypothetical protein